MDKKLIVAGAVGLLGLAYLLSRGGGDEPLGSAGGGGSSGFVISPVPPGDGESLIREEGDGGVVYNIAMPAPAPVELPPPDVVFATPDYPEPTAKKKTIEAPSHSLGSPVDTFGTRTDTGEAIPVYEGGSSLSVFAVGPSGYSTPQPVFSAPAESKKDSLATPAPSPAPSSPATSAPTTFVGTVDAGYASGGILGGLSAAVRSVFGGWF